MSITQLWTAFLATLATVAIGIIWVFSQGNGEAVLQSEGNALRAVANASLAALESEIDRSNVVVAQDFVRTRELENIARRATQSSSPGRFARSFRDLAYQGPLNRYPDLNFALVDPWGDLFAEAGLANDEMRTIAKMTRRSEETQERTQRSPVLTMISNRPFVLSIYPIKQSDLRLISLAPLHATGEGPIRRSLGSSYPGALMWGQEIALELSGSGTIASLSKDLPAQTNLAATGISDYFLIGQGVDRRVAVSGRLAEKYRFGKNELSLLVLSPNNAGYQKGGLWNRLSSAWSQLTTRSRGMIFLCALWMASVGISLVLPRVEWILPIQRLIAALQTQPSPASSSDQLSQGPWNHHFEGLVAAIAQRTRRAATHRGWQISTRGGAISSGTSQQNLLLASRDAAPTTPTNEPVDARESAA